MKEVSPVTLNDKKLSFQEDAEHVGIIWSSSGNIPNVLACISSHKRALSAVMHAGAARSHRANPIA